ncbi:ABC transporter ATP-binding protein [Phyllobacterium sp. OV277]|uniref:ABC transporter ATP-binding protein n=1 Tax=Phyllobacterium sp. OV277 TaxID=1882772 RepID=UPI0008917B15|nr:ABC transporter ATP-binding protein [Phyllobacterium sp. OV277]SDP84536.1 spermidine/putrescine transport system ATP-binding protein [Phyllobacterium sp. OV277]
MVIAAFRRNTALGSDEQVRVERSSGETAPAIQIAAEVTGLQKIYNPSTPQAFQALKDINLTIRSNEFFTLLGPSGCGKTTLLRILGGFEAMTEGTCRIFGQDVSLLPPEARPVNTVFQQYALFPHMTVRRNIAFGLEMLGRPKSEVASVVDRMLALVSMTDYADRKPDHLSGGQRQRVALARALAPQPKLLLLDEPLSALDLKLRQKMRLELKALQRETGITFIFVTHDQEEALAMSDRVAVLSDGRLQQVGTPEEIYEQPQSRFVADFIGESNLLCATVNRIDGALVEFRLAGLGSVNLNCSEILQVGQEVTLSIRPERIALSAVRGQCGLGPAVIFDRTYLGNAVEYHLRAGEQTLTVRSPRGGLRGLQDFAPGDSVFLAFEPNAPKVLTT